MLQFAVLSVCILPFGAYMAKVYLFRPTGLTSFLGPVEAGLYSAAGIDPSQDMDWRTYALAALTFSSIGFVVLYTIMVCQAGLPGNPAHVPGLAPDKAFVVTVSYVTHTDLLPASFVSALSPFARTVGLTVQTFLSAAVGMSVFIAIVRGLAGKKAGRVGNFWVDLVRTNLYILMPLSLVFVGLVATSGVSETIDDFARNHISAAAGALPAAGDETLRLIFTRGGSLINATTTQTAVATPTTGLINCLSVLLIPSALCVTFSIMIDDRAQAIVALIAGAIGVLAWFGDAAGLPAGTDSLLSGDAGLLFGWIAGLILVAAGLSWLRGREARYLGRRLSPFELLMAATACLVPCTLVLLGGALRTGLPVSAGMNASTLYALLSLVVLFGRFWVMIPALAMAGSLSARPPAGATV